MTQRTQVSVKAFDAKQLFCFESRIFQNFIWGRLAPTMRRAHCWALSNESRAAVEGLLGLDKEATCASALG